MSKKIEKQIEDTESELQDMLKTQKNESEEEDESSDDIEEEDDEESEEEDGESDDDSEDEESEEDEESDEEDEVDEEEESDDEEEEDAGDDDESEEDEDESDEDDDSEEEPVKRSKKDGDEMIPKWQLKAALSTLRKDFKKDLEKMAGLKTETRSKKVDEIVEKYGLKKDTGPQFVSDLADVVAEKFGLTPDLKKDLSEIRSIKDDLTEQKEFEREWRGNTKLVSKLFPKASSKDIRRIKDKVHDLAYTKKYAHYSVADIIQLNKGKLLLKKTKSFDGHRSATKKGATVYDLDNPDSIPFDKLSLEEFEKVSNALASRGKKNKFAVTRSKK